MERYFFDVENGKGRQIDTEGHQYSTDEEARDVAVQELAEIFRDNVPDGRQETFTVTVRNSDKVPIYFAFATVMARSL